MKPQIEVSRNEARQALRAVHDAIELNQMDVDSHRVSGSARQPGIVLRAQRRLIQFVRLRAALERKLQ